MKKTISFIFALTIIFSCMQMFTFADVATLSVEDAVLTAKTKLNLVTEGLELYSNFYDSDTGATWNLNWEDKEYTSSINVAVDAENGNILSYYSYSYLPNETYSKIPKYSRDEASGKALEVIKNIQPAQAELVKLDESYNYDTNSLVRSANDTYSFKFIRYIEEIPYSQNFFEVSLNKNTLEVQSYYFTWDKKEITPLEDKTGIEKAKELFKDGVGLEAVYMLKGDDRYDVKSTTEKTARLVYIVKDYNKIIDAVTGEVIDRNIYQRYVETGMSNAKGMPEDSAVELTPDEMEEISNYDNLVSKEEALKIAYQYLNSDYELDYQRLSKGYNDDNYYWNFNWNKTSKENGEDYGYQSITIDATTGRITSLYAYDSNDYKENEEAKYDKEECQKIAEAFLNKIAPEEMKTIVLNDDTNYNYPDDYEPNEYYFNYSRTLNDIRVAFNSIYVSVNVRTGKVVSYSLNWFDFIDETRVYSSYMMSLEEAYEILFDKVGLELEYIKILDENDEEKTVLGYVISDDKTVYIDAYLRQLVDYTLKPIVEDEEKAEFTDIEGHWAEEDIKLLADLGIIEKEEKFNPKANVTQLDVIKMLVNAMYSDYYYSENPNADEYYRTAIQNGILTKEERNDEKEVARIEVAKMVVNILGVSSVAKLDTKVFVNDFTDVDDKYIGYVSIVNGFDIMHGFDRTFTPDVNVTRAQMATVTVRLLER